MDLEMLAACWKIFLWSWSVHYLENIRRVLLKFAMLIKLTVLSLHKRFENTEKYHKHMVLLLFHNNNKTPLLFLLLWNRYVHRRCNHLSFINNSWAFKTERLLILLRNDFVTEGSRFSFYVINILHLNKATVLAATV